MQRTAFFLALFSLLFVLSCKKEEIIKVPGNVAPPDGTIEDIAVESYINRSYISLLGRKPEATEANAAFSQLRAGGFSRDSRRDFIQGLTSATEFDQRVFAVGRALYLNSADTTDIREQRDLFNLLLASPQYQAFWPQLTLERDRLNGVLAIPADFAANNLSIIEMHKRLIYNYFYDQINMGTQNFVVSMFQNFLFRYPSTEELSNGEAMVDGFISTIFLQNGRNKEDFINIFFNTGDYFEGQVRDVHLRLLFREPSTQEIELLAIPFKDTGDYEAMLQEVLSSDEYAGI